MRKNGPLILLADPGEEDILITLRDTRRILSVSENHLTVLIRRGALGPVVKLGPRTTRLRLTAVRDFVASQTS
jgi:hypothetical protein